MQERKKEVAKILLAMSRGGGKKAKTAREALAVLAIIQAKILKIIIFFIFFLFSHLQDHSPHCSIFTSF